MDKQLIFNDVLKAFLDMPVGSESSVVLLAESAGHKISSDDILFDLYSFLLEASVANGYDMDYSEYDDMEVGLPFNLHFYKRERSLS